MEITEHSLKAMLKAVDDQHRDGMRTMTTDIQELHRETGTLRGEVSGSGLSPVGLGVGGAALALGATAGALALLASPAFAAGDGDIAAFAQSVELAAVAAYTAAASSGLVKTPGVLTAATLFAGHHKEHAAAFGSAAGKTATNKENPKLLAAVSKQLSGAKDENSVIEIAYGLENAAAATYLFALGALQSAAALQLTASILPVESQHAVVLGEVLGKSATDIFPSFTTTDGFVDPTQYPVA
jgi:hypothetical protein